jgi:hypothetical protein
LSLLFSEILWEVFVFAKTGKTELAGNKIRELEQLKESYGSQATKEYLSFHVHRMKCFVYCWSVSSLPSSTDPVPATVAHKVGSKQFVLPMLPSASVLW